MVCGECFFAKSFSRRVSENSDWFTFQVTSDLRSSFDLSVNHLGILLHDKTLGLVLHGFLVEVDRWDGRAHFAKLQIVLPLLHLHRFLDASGLAGCSFALCDAFLLVLRLVSVAVLWFALPVVGFALLPAVGFALLGSFHHCSRSSMFFSFGPRNLVALLHSSRRRLVGCGSVSDSLTIGSLAVVRLCFFFRSQFVVGDDSVVRFWLLSTPLLSIAPLRD